MRFALFCLLSALSVVCHAQSAVIRGNIYDATGNVPLRWAAVLLLRTADNSIAGHSRADADGRFTLKEVAAGAYLLKCSMPTYNEVVRQITVKAGDTLVIDSIMLTHATRELQEVTIVANNPAVRLRGDTLEFLADSFKVKRGASVEELLKALPGIQVDKNGKIVVQGKTINKILVDGDEFFGEDPTIATRQLQAEIVNKVQVFDKKSEQALFSGIDDGNEKKTINLSLKKDRAKGLFGKLEAGGGTNDKWNNSAMVNYFTGPRKISAYMLASNTGTTGLSWAERDKYAAGNNVEYDADLGVFNYTSGDDGGGAYDGHGLPRSINGGLNYSDKFNQDKNKLNLSYRYYNLNLQDNIFTNTQTTLPTGDQYARDTAKKNGTAIKNALQGYYDFQLGKRTSMKISVDGSLLNTEKAIQFSGMTTGENTDTINKSNGNIGLNSKEKQFNFSWLLRQQFKKTGRTLSVDFTQKYLNTDNTQQQTSTILFVNQPLPSSIIDQLKTNENQTNSSRLNVVYTEPLTKSLFLQLGYTLHYADNQQSQLTFARDNHDAYDIPVDSLSGRYQLNFIRNQMEAGLKFVKGKIISGATLGVGTVNLNQRNLITNVPFNTTFNNLLPRFNFIYKISTGKRLVIRYYATNKLPVIWQLQPLYNNDNVLNERIGNPLLGQETIHTTEVNYAGFSTQDDKGIDLSAVSNVIHNAIVANTTTTSSGKTTTSYVNMNGAWNLNLNSNVKFKTGNFRINAGPGIYFGQEKNIVNNLPNITRNFSPGLNAGFNTGKDQTYYIDYSLSVNYNILTSRSLETSTTNFWNSAQTLNITVPLWKKWELNNNVTLNLLQSTPLYPSSGNVLLWNLYIGRWLLADKAMIKVQANDLLNQNKGFNRRITNTQVVQESYQRVMRFFLLSFTWNFNNSSKK